MSAELAQRWGISEQAADLHRDALVWEGIVSWISMDMMNAAHDKKAACLPRYFDSGANLVSLTVAGDFNGTLERAVRYLARTRQFLQEEHGDLVRMVHSVDDIRTAKAEGKLAVTLHFQGTQPMSGNFNEDPGDISMVSLYYDLGVKQALLAHNLRNVAADGCHEPDDAGLSAYGRRLIAEMNRVGMIVDCTHTGYRSSMQAMEVSRLPCIFSHSNCKAIFDHPRNITDEQIKVCAALGGVIGVCGWGPIVNAQNDASVPRVMEHLDHMVQLVGPEHVAIGLDYVYDPVLTSNRMQAQPDLYAPGETMAKFGYDVPLMDFMPPEALPGLTQAMMDRGYPPEAIRGILGENLARVSDAIWRTPGSDFHCF